MSDWAPRATVACVLAEGDRYLLVEERDKTSGEMVFNQPAGHLEPGESLVEGAMREVLEETGWTVEVTGVIGMGLYQPPGNDFTYFRTTFTGRPVARGEGATIDPDIHAVHWLTYEEITALSARMRSPMVLDAIERHRRGLCYPLDMIYEQ